MPGHQRPEASGRRIGISRRRKFFYGLIVCGLFFAILELALQLIGVAPVTDETDPFAGFSSRFPLFTSQPPSSASALPVLTTAENRLSLFNRQLFLAEKPANECRIFCLGGSTTYGRPYDDQTSFAGFMREALPNLDPGREWEVVNAGGISYGSVRIALLMRELVRYKPDVFILYTGHNEFLEDLTYASMIQTPETVRTLGGWAAHSRTFSLIQRFASGGNSPNQSGGPVLSDEVNALLDRSVGPSAYHRDEEWQRKVIAQFQSSLEQIITLAEASGAKVVLVTPASSLRDCEPFKSEHRDNLSGEELQLFRRHFASATDALRAGMTEVALQNVSQALEIDNQYAAAQYLRGRILLITGDATQAREAFQLALEEDVCPLRASDQIVNIVHEVADRHKLPLLDFSRQMTDAAEYNIPGSDWFLDHVHPTIAGHRLLARELCDLLVDVGVATARKGWGRREFDKVADRVEAQIDPEKHAVALRNLAKVLSWAGKSEDADRLALMAIEQLPNDTETQSMAGFAALRQDRLGDAEKHFTTALQIDPKNAKALNGLGNVLTRKSRYAEARDCFARAVEIDAGNVTSWFNLGNVCKELGQLKNAADAYQQSLSLESAQPDVHKNLGLVYIAEGNLQAAINQFESALRLQPDSPQRHAELGFLFIDTGDTQRAADSFNNALSIDPECVPGLIGKALVLEQRGNNEGAAELIRRSIELEPSNENLHGLLKRLVR